MHNGFYNQVILKNVICNGLTAYIVKRIVKQFNFRYIIAAQLQDREEE
jgi:hypothetical protein